MWAAIGLIAGLGSVALWTTWRGAPAVEKPVMRVTVPTGPIVVHNILHSPVALSPDDTRLVYVAENDGREQLFLRDLASSESTPIPGTEGGTQPFFSPDGQWMGFFAEGSMKKVSLLGGPPLTLTGIERFARGASWGSGGSIFYGEDSTNLIQQVSVDGGPSQTVTALEQE
jgi:serine/threonine-protein kinase